jgi:transcriptional regulator with XRE-family HTH domain
MVTHVNVFTGSNEEILREEILRVKRKMKAKVKINSGLFAPTIRRLRRFLHETQDGMARELGLKSVRAYQFWESGECTPRGRNLEKLSRLAEERGLKRIHWAMELEDHGESLQPPPSPVNQKRPGMGPQPDTELLEYYNDAVTGLKLIREAALAGHAGAKEALRAERERLVRRSTQWRDLKYAKVK